VQQVEQATTSHNTQIQLVLITATVANLSKTIYYISKKNTDHPSRLINDIIHDKVVEHHFVPPPTSYVGPSWFIDSYQKLVFPSPLPDHTPHQYQNIKNNIIVSTLANLSPHAKRLSLIVTSTRTDDHRTITLPLIQHCGYNVVVELNGTNNKNYIIHYVSDNSTVINTWEIPFTSLQSLADTNSLSTILSSTTPPTQVPTRINQKEDLSLSHILQASLFMMTEHEPMIKESTSQEEFNKLLAISRALTSPHFHPSKRRPIDFPTNPKVALVAGHLAGRGITIQNPTIAFTCSSFLFTDTKDASQRGATNAQRFGRACGMLKEIFTDPSKPAPILIATPAIMKDALANEQALSAAASQHPNGTLIALKDLITTKDWQKAQRETKQRIKALDEKNKAPLKPKPLIKPLIKDHPKSSKVTPLRKNGIITTVPKDAIILSEYIEYTRTDFIGKYNINTQFDFKDTSTLHKIMLTYSIDAHISLATISANTVSDLSNFFKNPSWCYKPYQIIIKDNKVAIIKRYVEKIKDVENMNVSHVFAHTPSGTIQSYIVKKTTN
jgi:hypothetical protein